MPSTRIAAARIAIALVTAAIALELALQVLALVVGGNARSPAMDEATPADGARVVLCVGDSFTFGMGASSPATAYPRQLEQRLRERLGGTWRVVNAGRPGIDSRDIAEEFDALLARHRPEFVCVLGGVNDTWRRRGRAGDDAVTAGFRWRWRSADLVRLLVHGRGLFDEAPAAATPVVTPSPIPRDHPLVGAWRVVATGASVFFAHEGSCDLLAARVPWSIDGDSIVIGRDREAVAMTLTIDGDFASLRAAGQEPLMLVRARDLPSGESARKATLATLLEAGGSKRWPDVLLLGRELLDDPALDRDTALEALPPLAVAAQETSDGELLARVVTRLRALHDEAPSARSRESLADLFVSTGLGREALDVLDGPPAGEPLSPRGQVMLAYASIRTLPRDEALACVERLLAASREGDEQRSSLWCVRFRAVPFEARDEQARSMIRAWRASPSSAEVEQVLRQESSRTLREDQLRSVATAEGLSEGEIESFVLAWRGDEASRAEWQDALAANLRRIATRARAAGARVVFGTYPFQHRELSEHFSNLARELAAPLADTAALIPHDPASRAQFFVADGHCNDQGYARMAEAFVEGVVAAMGR
ncbi:MAG: hypothetical protein HZB39_11300 [Planctomycetes bacterium]|nr:hypothetical protein [Planctomycetota bacterium]